jgi:hypothetical protein
MITMNLIFTLIALFTLGAASAIAQVASDATGFFLNCDKAQIERVVTLSRFKITNAWERVIVNEFKSANGVLLPSSALSTNFVSRADLATKDVRVINVLPSGPLVLSGSLDQTNVFGRTSIVPLGCSPAIRMNVRRSEVVYGEVQVAASLPGQALYFEQHLIKAR